MVYKKYITYIIICLVTSNCSYYSFKGTIPSHINSISILPIINQTSESNLSNDLSNSFNELLIKENILDIVDLYGSDSKLTIIINSVSDKPNIFISTGTSYEEVEQWKLMINITLEWYNITFPLRHKI